MRLQKIIHTCSNVHVAGAALSCIGGEFASIFTSHATQDGLSPSVLASRMVTEFSERASGDHWDDLASAIRGSDHPILSGLHHILSRSVVKR